MNTRPTVLVSRKLLNAVEERLEKDYLPCLNRDDHPYSTEEANLTMQNIPNFLNHPFCPPLFVVPKYC